MVFSDIGRTLQRSFPAVGVGLAPAMDAQGGGGWAGPSATLQDETAAQKSLESAGVDAAAELTGQDRPGQEESGPMEPEPCGSAEEGVPHVLSCAVKQWGLLRWDERWITFSDGVFSLYRTIAAPGDADSPYLQLPVSDPLTVVEADPLNPQRLRLENGVACIHLKFGEPADRDACTAVVAHRQLTSAIELDTARFPFQIGKYWLGPMAPDGPPPKGGFGFVMAGINSDTGERVCAKINHNVDFEGTPAQRQEIMLQAMVQHEGVVVIKDVLKEVPPRWSESRQRWVHDGSEKIVMIMEVMDGGELYSEVVDNGGLPEDKARYYFRQILLGLAHCHGRGIAHRDIKLENLMLSGDKTACKIVDFGLSKVSKAAQVETSELDDTLVGTIQYAAPEMYLGTAGGGHDHRRADIWAAGVCLFAMTECAFAFKPAIVRAVGDEEKANGGFGGPGKKDPTPTDTRIMNAILSATHRLRPERSPEYKAFMTNLLCVDPAARYTAVQALHDPWILGADWSVEHVDGLAAALDSEPTMAPPSDYSEAELLELMATGRDDRGRVQMNC